MNQILLYHWSVATWKKNYKEKTNEIIKLRERFSVVKFASFLIFVDGAKKKKKTTAADFQSAKQ